MCVDDVVGVATFERCPRVVKAFGEEVIDTRPSVLENVIVY